ncbi:MAG: VCBS repeat-containing protein [Verrucomicrobiaceae bacterium]|nr:VCBS repeat-containing protein [Verrucomicrobiaceae bacterium]
MTTKRIAAIYFAIASVAMASDSTPPLLSITHSWVQKVGTAHAFKLLLDPQDETGIDKVQYRFVINSKIPIPGATAWTDLAWQRDTPLTVQQVCKSIQIEMRALDAAGNASAIQKREFSSPFPLGTTPNLYPKFVGEKLFTNSGPTFDCRGLFGADFDGDGRDDIMQVDRASGTIKVRKQQSNGTYVSNGFNVAANAVSDSAVGDFNGDGRPDLALVLSGGLVVYQNNGPDGLGTLQFSVMSVGGLATTGITTVVGIAAGNVSNDTKEDLIISGTGTDTRIAVLIHNDQFQLGASNYAIAYPTSTPGAVRLGDVTGDGKTDVVMIDAANNGVLTFLNTGLGNFHGADDVNTAVRPIATSTGADAIQAIAVGDVSGDGRADLVFTQHQFGDFYVTGEFRDFLTVRFYDSRGAAPFHPNGGLDGGFGPTVASATTFRSDVMLMDLNDDRFPEIVVATPFGSGENRSGVRAWRMTSLLDNTNLLTFSFPGSILPYNTLAAAPHRLASSRFQSSRADVLLASGDNAEAVQFVLSSYSPSSKTYDLITGASTDSDANGSAGTNGIYTYDVDVGGLVTYSLHYVNNTDAAVTGAVVECLLPSNLSLLVADEGHTLVPAGASKYVRWTLDVPAGSSGVKVFSVRVLSGANGSKLALKGNFKRGSTTLVTKPMPVVELQEPLSLTISTTTTSSPINGDRAHIEETITYQLEIENNGTGTISGYKLTMSTPANTTLIGTTPSPTSITGTYPNITDFVWNGPTLNPNGTATMEVRVKVKTTTKDGTIIKNSTATVTRADGQKVIAPPDEVVIDPPLEVSVSSNKNIAHPGETIRYTVTAKNWLPTAITGAKVNNVLPSGTSLLAAGVNDGTGGPGSNGSFRFVTGTWPAADLNPTTLPAYFPETREMFFVLGTVGGGEFRYMEYDLVVGQDVPSTVNVNGVSTPMEVSITPVFWAVFGTKTLFAAEPPPARPLLSDPPLAAPKLTLTKEAVGDGVIFRAGERIITVIDDKGIGANGKTISTDGLCDYKLTYRNEPGGGAALGVVVRDYIPEEMTFIGSLERNGSTVPSLVDYRFYDAAGKEMKIVGAEGYTDTPFDNTPGADNRKANGFYDVGEVFNDANGNRKYDGVTAALVRSIGFPAGDLNASSSGHFVYRVQVKTSVPTGRTIISQGGGVSGVKNGLAYTLAKGYHLTATNLHFPVGDTEDAVKVLTTLPAIPTLPVGVVKSRSTLADNESITLSIPYEVTGGQGVALSGMKMDTVIPKGFQVALAQVFNTAGQVVETFAPGATNNTFSISAPDSKGARKLSFPLGSLNIAFPTIKINLDPATKAALQNTKGQTREPLELDATVSGSYVKPSSARSARAAGVNPLIAMAKIPVKATVPVQVDSGKDAKIFVGRCAPVSVKRGDTFSYTIMVGNLSNLALDKGIIEMSIPDGCDYISASSYRYNANLISTTTETYGNLNVAKKKGSKVTWEIYALLPREGGAVTLTVKVRDDFTGTRINDNTCIFDTENAMGKSPGPLSVFVRSGNEGAQAADVTKSAANGLLGEGLPAIPIDFLTGGTFAGQAEPLVTSFGGADILQLNNGVTVVQLGGGRVLAVGPSANILASSIRLVKDSTSVRVAVGPGDSSNVQLAHLPTLSAGTQPANTVLANLFIPANSLVAAGGGNLVAAGGGNLVAAGGGNLVGQDGSTLSAAYLVGQDGSTFMSIADLVNAGGGKLVGQDGSTLVAAGGGNLVAAGGGNIVAAGAGHLVGNDGASVIARDGAGLIAKGAGNLVGQDGATLVAAGGGNLVAAGGGNFINRGGVTILANLR